MNQNKNITFIIVFLLATLTIISCNRSSKRIRSKIVSTPEKMDQQTSKGNKETLEFAVQHKGQLDDSINLRLSEVVNNFYINTDFENVWSSKEKWHPIADSVLNLIQNAALSGLFPNDYHYKNLKSLKTILDNDSLKRMDANLWTKADLMLTDGFLHIVKDLKDGRLGTDSITHKKVTADTFLIATLSALISTNQLTPLLNQIEPKQIGYISLKNCLPKFLDSMDNRIYTYINYPFKKNDVNDSLTFIKNIQKRLNESKAINFVNNLPDSLELNTAVKVFQKLKKLKQDGIISTSLIKIMNLNDVERFKRIAITLDRYKQLPDSMPEKYIWVNLPSYYLQVWDHDTLVLNSRIICGKPATPTPLLTSYITDMVTYPTWTVPNSIITKQYLPKLKINPNYLSQIGLKLVDAKGELINPNEIVWSKYSKGIPYKVVQNSGDDNALGILKFNFSNPFAVYLHDTNQRYLFKNTGRALSHGCVRVQEWDSLAFYLAKNDSLNLKTGDSLRYTSDSIKTWLANKEHKRIAVKNKVSLFILYFSCEAKNGRIKFYDDVYGDDKVMREKYFAGN